MNQSVPIESKHCPFCGCPEVGVTQSRVMIGTYRVICPWPECLMQGPVGSSPAEAFAKWNARRCEAIAVCTENHKPA